MEHGHIYSMRCKFIPSPHRSFAVAVEARLLQWFNLMGQLATEKMVIDTCEPDLVDDAFEYQVLFTSLTDNLPMMIDPRR